MDGAAPVIEDSRVSFFKGWFAETLPQYILPPHERLFVRNSFTRAISCSAWLVRIRVLRPSPWQEPMCFAAHSKTWTACGVEQPTRME